MPGPQGFEYSDRGSEVVITHRGAKATVLRGERAEALRREVASGDPQELMARLTGNYRRGNERTAKRHPRNQSR